MRILILGGTVFLGRHLASLALARGHELTLFHRGQHGRDLFPEAERLFGDRDGGLDLLTGRQWDVAIDTCGYLPRIVEGASARALAASVEHYTFVSTLSVYDDDRVVGRTEAASLGTLEDPSTELVDGATYGPLKVLCEAAAEVALPGRVLVVRPGLIVGPHDPSDRFTYWPVRVARGGEVLAPEGQGRVQIVDVRDLANWMLDLAERRTTGVFNATGPATRLTFGAVLDTCQGERGAETTITYASWPFLEEQRVAPYLDLPLWIPDIPAYAGSSTVDCTKAIQAGLAFRALEETVGDTLAWAQARPADHEWRAGLTAGREAELLEAWRNRSRRTDAG